MFIVLKVTNPKPHIRGYLKRYFFEPETNMFLGSPSRKVIESLWERITEIPDIKTEEPEDDIEDAPIFSASLVVFRKDLEQGFEYRHHSENGEKNASRNFDEIELFGDLN